MANMPTDTAIQKRTLLVVDDIEINRAVISEIFAEEFNIIEAKNGDEALKVLRDNYSSISLMLLDIFMPVMDGFTFLAEKSNHPNYNTIPVIILSSGSDLEFELKAIEYGAVDYITKPIEPRIVKLRVRSALNKQESDRLRFQNEELRIRNEEEKKYQAVLEGTNTLVLEYDMVTGETNYDPAFSTTFPANFNEREPLLLIREARLADESEINRVETFFNNFIANETSKNATTEFLLKTVSGESRYFRLSVVKSINSKNGNPTVIAALTDINTEVLFRNRLQFLAEYDLITGLYNKQGFLDKLEALKRENESKSYCIISLDIEKFKIINDFFGFSAGDELLRSIAGVLKEYCEKHGGFSAHISSDNFAVVYENTDLNKNEFWKLTLPDGSELSSGFEVKYRFGVYITNGDKTPVRSMLDRAVLAQRNVSNSFGNSIAYYDDTLRIAMIQEKEIESMLAPAIENREFVVYYQPKCNLLDGKIIGAEALVRWEHPVKGRITPDKFIPICEKNGFIAEVDYYVWESVCVYLRSRIDAGAAVLPISVNISRVNIYNKELKNLLSGLVEKYNIPKELLELEITENAYVNNATLLNSMVEELRGSGFVVHMDDFGSGYSSLNVLQEAPFDVLKIDQRFLRNKDESGKTGNILSAIIRMAKNLGMDIIAEGVETAAQAEFLRSIGCTKAQGFLFYRPMPQDEYDKTLSENIGNPQKVISTLTGVDIKKVMSVDSDVSSIINLSIGGVVKYELGNMNNRYIEIVKSNDEYARDFYRTTGKSLQNEAGRSEGGFQFINDGERDKALELLEKCKDLQITAEYSYERKHLNGDIFVINAKAKCISYDDVRAFYYVSVTPKA